MVFYSQGLDSNARGWNQYVDLTVFLSRNLPYVMCVFVDCDRRQCEWDRKGFTKKTMQCAKKG